MHSALSLLFVVALTFAELAICQAPSSQVFDFVIVGGGTCGLTVANRLSELPNITVAVVEAGGAQNHNPNVTSVDGFTSAFNTPIDWQYESTNQTNGANRQLEYHAGKALGGTSTINGMTYVRAENVEIDSWETIGNSGWNWESLFPYYKKSEDFTYPSTAQLAAGASFVADDHGENGPLKVGYQYDLTNGSLHEIANETWQGLGIPFNPDVNGGHVRGFTVWPNTLDRDANVREDAARAYYYPIQSRPNLFVFRATANRIVWKNSSAAEAIAVGVEIMAPNGTVSVVTARAEVILSAGSLRSPALLELSGVGNPDTLSKFNIPLKVNLPSVGENLQDQPNSAIVFNSTTSQTGYPPYVAYADVFDLFGNATLAIAAQTNSSLGTWATLISTASNNTVSASALERLFQIQHDLIFKNRVAFAEIISTASSTELLAAFWILLPFSRGSVHIASSDPLAYPLINPNFFAIDWDLTVQTAVARLSRRFFATQPMAGLAVAEITPGLATVPANATDSQWAEWLTSTFNPNYHPISTAAMMPRDMGGVVDPTLTVYGTSNVRVVDASIMPLQVSGHLTSTLYAVAERAADLIKADL